jgi:uncharacterized membrane protein YoaK (UPF0700 family)
VLAGVAGFVDVVGYLTLHHLFTAHMTGNASKLGVALGHGNLPSALPLAVVPVLFVAGAALGTLILDRGSRRVALLVQAALVAAFMGYAGHAVRHGTVPGHGIGGFYVLATLATVALGLQAAALTGIGGVTVRTTYVSGQLTRLAQESVRRLGGGGDRDVRLGLIAGIWLCYVAGATLGSFGLDELSTWALAIPVTALLAASCAS